MLDKLRRNLILLYTFSTSLILTLVIVILFISSFNQGKNFQKESFQSTVFSISSSIKREYVVNNSKIIKLEEITDYELSKLEKMDKMIIDMKETNPDFKGAWTPKTNRDALLERLESELNKIQITSNIFKDEEIQKPTITIKGDNRDYYYGASISIPGLKDDIYVMQYIDFKRIMPIKKVIYYLCIETIGILALAILSRVLVKKSLAPIEENMKEQKEFVAAASHELKSPLAVIQANASAIKFNPDNRDEYIKGVNTECKRMSRLIQDLLFLSSSDSCKLNIKKEYIDTETFLIDAYERYRSFCSESQHSLEINLPEEELPFIYVDKERLEQVFSILIDNAVGYSSSNTNIKITSFVKDKNIYFEFEDHGIGIPDYAKKNIFNRFYRVDSSRTDKKHFGLGLSIVQEIVNMHSGSIYLRDTLNGGCTFIIKIPIEV